MDPSIIGKQFIEAALFGLVVAGGYLIIRDSPLWWRQWLALSRVLAWLCWIMLFGLVKF